MLPSLPYTQDTNSATASKAETTKGHANTPYITIKQKQQHNKQLQY